MNPEALEAAVMDAIDDPQKTIPVSVKVGEREFELNFHWPNLEDEQEIERRAVIYANGFPAEIQNNLVFEVSRGRALIEVITANPYPEWMPHGEARETVRGKVGLRPDTSKLRSRALIAGFYRAWSALYLKYQEHAI